MKPMLFFICGPHACGKSTILQHLLERKVFTQIGLEIGKVMYYEKGIASDQLDTHFEDIVTQKELARDDKFATQIGVIGVESWHPGNLAYALVRNKHHIDSLLSEMKHSPFIDSAFGIWVMASTETIQNRTTLFQDKIEWVAEFYGQINYALPEALRLLGFEAHYATVDGNRELHLIVDEIEAIVNKVLCSSSSS